MNTVAPAERAARYREMLRLPAAVEDWEFTSVLISRPVGFVLLHALERFDFITPNRITVLGFLCFLGASFLILQSPSSIPAISALLFARLVFDDFDGMLARARRASSHFGSYLDKITDVIGFFAFFMALGLHESTSSGSLRPLVLASAGITALVTTGYIKWVVRAMEPPPQSAAPSPATPAPPPSHPRWRVFLILLLRLAAVNECDIFLIAIALVLFHAYGLLLWGLALSQLALCAGMILKRGYRAWMLDRMRI